MGLAGFCRNCLATGSRKRRDGTLDKDAAREAIYGMPYAEWKARIRPRRRPSSSRGWQESVAKNA